MKTEELEAYCLQKPESYRDQPFGPEPVCFKVRKRIFAQIYPTPDDFKITLKCEPVQGDFYRMQFPGVVLRGYHCPPVQQPFWNTVYLNETVSDELVYLMIDQAYRAVIEKLNEKVKRIE
jgi:predicted DNA-binding protein (MmcQ/YjbR family)